MTKNKNQHYIPRLLLKRFLTQTPRGLHIFRFQRGGVRCEEIPLSRAGSETYFYRDGIDPDQPDALDEVLNVTESRIEPIIRELCDSHQLPIPGSDQSVCLIRFVHDLYLRTPSMRVQLTAVAPRLVGKIMDESFFGAQKVDVEARLARMMAASPEQRYIAELFLFQTGQTTSLSEGSRKILHRDAAGFEHTAISTRLAQRSWRVLVAPAHGPNFVIGDEPVVVHDSKGSVRSGLIRATSRVSVPLSPTVVLQGCYSQVERQAVLISPLDARKLNGVFARAAYREVFSNQSDFEWQHQAGSVFTSREWMAGIPEAIRPSNPK